MNESIKIKNITVTNKNTEDADILIECAGCKKRIPFYVKICPECKTEVKSKVVVDGENNVCSCCGEIVPMWLDNCPKCRASLNWEHYFFS